MFKKFERKLEEADDLGGGAGGIGDDAPPIDDGGAPPVDDGGTPPAEFTGPAWAKDLQLDADILNDPSLKAINDLQSLTKSYVHAQKRIGQKGTIIPTENSTSEEWDTFHQKMGVPLKAEEYTEAMKFTSREEGGQFDDSFNQLFASKAHELRVQPSQAKEMYDFFNDQAKSTAENFMETTQAGQQEKLNDLMNSYGEDAYNANLTKAMKYVNEELGEETLTYLKESGLGKDAKIVDMLMKTASKFYKEGDIPAGESPTSLSKDQAQKEINDAMANPADPYLNSSHPDHSRRVKEIQKYFAILDK